MTSVPRILVDAHGGDAAPDMVIEALTLLANDKRMHIGVVGIAETIQPLLEKHNLAHVAIVAAKECINMHDAPAQVLRGKRHSSMHIGAQAVRAGNWHAFVSAGNTGALMAVSRLILRTLPNIERPAIGSMIPRTNGGYTLLLDAGANVGCSSDQLVQFALLGSCYMQAAENISTPRVALLNIGEEDMKGTDEIKVAAQELQRSPLAFIGNVEGSDLFSEKADVVVCDGFVGNVALKTMEGVARMMGSKIKSALMTNLRSRTGALLAKPALKQLFREMDPGEYNGAPLLGLNGVVVKSHGGVDAYAFGQAIHVARRQVAADLGRITQLAVAEMLEGSKEADAELSGDKT
ncbi:MAG: phosphate acyltransferase PlsX [Mariprofundales bacterium]